MFFPLIRIINIEVERVSNLVPYLFESCEKLACPEESMVLVLEKAFRNE